MAALSIVPLVSRVFGFQNRRLVMKAFTVLLFLVFNCYKLTSVPIPDYQLLSVEKFSKHTNAKLILVRNDTLRAVEVHHVDIGSVLICVAEQNRLVLRDVRTSMFKQKDHVLVRFWRGT